MKPSDPEQVRAVYDATAESYAEIMETEIELPVYSDVLGRLYARIEGTPGRLIDTSCGSGHMLFMYHERHEQSRSLLGVDLSPRMVDIASKRLGSRAEVIIADMRDLSDVEAGSAAAILSFFAIHHLDRAEVGEALREWHRVLRPGGELIVAAWEGDGAIDYGEEGDIVALRYGADELASIARAAGFAIVRCVVEPVAGMPMDAVYLEGVKG